MRLAGRVDDVNQRITAPALIATTKLVVSLALLGSGFVAVSDDDFSRVTIAQHFAAQPQLDPTGTSWLPLPFWVYGGAMTAFGPSLTTARVTALLLGVYAAVGVWLAARALGLGPRSALIGALLAACIPHAAYYGAAMVPDYTTAVLALGAVATLGSAKGPLRCSGAVLACLASLCRYETWPIAAVTAGYALFDARQPSRGRRWLVGTALIAPAGILAWILHGVVRHGDALFFLRRVAAYRRALGTEAESLGLRLLERPIAFFTGEPELVLFVLLVGLLVGWVRGRRALAGQGWQRSTVAIGSLLGFLIGGDLLGSAPTHHEERTLLTAWLALCLVAGTWIDRLFTEAQGAEPLSTPVPFARPSLLRERAVAGLAGVVALSLVLGSFAKRRDPFVDRSGELRIGLAARALLPEKERLAIYTEDYGFFAIQAALARPGASAPLLRRDPRIAERDPWSDRVALRRRLDELGAHYVVAPAHRVGSVGVPMTVESAQPGFVLLKRQPEP